MVNHLAEETVLLMGYQVYRSESQTDQNFSFELAQLRVSSCVLGALRIDLRKDDENQWRRDHRLIADHSQVKAPSTFLSRSEPQDLLPSAPDAHSSISL